ncbi:MAG: hypothetical protein P8O16_07860 [Algoriphagus sp.]|uniref:hypothetical protein n=1 Tax=Algoriphagus sp. TaxID=1872435 RepID=UPI0026212F98|nr:hypothetical protein [Algoriphagus sp.]MDG1277180.1 hypothetical protein [Algoriphagus sp.]
MNGAQFLELIHRSDTLEKNEVLQLKKVQQNFPYFQIAHVLVARYEFLKHGPGGTPSLSNAAITSPDRILLKSIIEKEIKESPDSERKLTKEDLLPESENEIPTASKRTETLVKLEASLKEKQLEEQKIDPPQRTRRKAPKDDLIETIRRKEKKEILDEKKKEQIDLIKAFSKKSIKMATIKEIEANQNTENLAASSTQISDKLISESFAKILANQGKSKMAKEIYQKLILKFPDKRTYFADLIEKLKE